LTIHPVVLVLFSNPIALEGATSLSLVIIQHGGKNQEGWFQFSFVQPVQPVIFIKDKNKIVIQNDVG
jgi:hypothetical protein